MFKTRLLSGIVLVIIALIDSDFRKLELILYSSCYNQSDRNDRAL